MKKFLLGSMTFASVMTFANEAQGAPSNPLLETWMGEYKVVPFDKIKAEDYEAAVRQGIKIHQDEIDAIVNNPQPATFENTIAALDRSGTALNGAVMVLGNLESALGSPELMETLAKVTPLLSDHQTGVQLNEGLWKRVKAVYDNRQQRTDLSPEA